MALIVPTPYGQFKVFRKDTVAITVFRARRPVCHNRVHLEEGDYGHKEHRQYPTNIACVKNGFGSWGEYIATYTTEGKLYTLSCCPLHRHKEVIDRLTIQLSQRIAELTHYIQQDYAPQEALERAVLTDHNIHRLLEREIPDWTPHD